MWEKSEGAPAWRCTWAFRVAPFCWQLQKLREILILSRALHADHKTWLHFCIILGFDRMLARAAAARRAAAAMPVRVAARSMSAAAAPSSYYPKTGPHVAEGEEPRFLGECIILAHLRPSRRAVSNHACFAYRIAAWLQLAAVSGVTYAHAASSSSFSRTWNSNSVPWVTCIRLPLTFAASRLLLIHPFLAPQRW